MSNEPDTREIVIRTAGTSKPVKTPTQALGIREAEADEHPADPTRKVHPDSVPLAGPVQPSRRDQVMPTAEPVVPKIDARSEDERTVHDAKIGT